jgi:twitching motility protein PilT
VAAAEEAAREAARVAAAEEAARIAAAEEAARVAAAEEAAREAARVAAAEESARVAAAEEAAREAARVAAIEEAQREAARLAAAEDAAREAARLAAEEEAQREAARVVAAEEAARVAAAEEAAREAARVAEAEEAARIAAAEEAARVAAAEQAARVAVRLAAEEAARVAAAEEAAREAARVAAAEEAEREAARVAAAEEAALEAARVAAAEEAAREAARVAAVQEAAREAARLAAEEDEREAARVTAAEEAALEAARVAAAEEAAREAVRAAAAEEAAREAARLAAAVESQREAARVAAAVDASRELPLVAASMEGPAASVEPRHQAAMAASVESTYQAPRARTLPPPQPAVVLNIARNPIRSEMPPPLVEDPTLSGLERLLRVSSARGASTLYLSSGSRPCVRVDGELQMLDAEPVLVPRDVESLLLTLMPERSHEALRTGAATEWICDLEGVGRVRCMSFRDQRGPGGVFRLMPTRSVSADQIGLPKAVQALAIEPEGLVLIAGPRSSGKRTTMSAFVDLMNRTRRDHIITIEREINIQHERGNSFISQREVRGSDDDVLVAARAAMREDPDVLVIEELRTGALINVALEAAAAGRLVVGGFTAPTATGAIDRIIDLYAPEYHRQVQMALADSMRGVIAQVLLRKVGGGRLPAREVLLNTPAVSGAIAEGKTSQLPMAIEGGRRYGMMPINDALVGLVQNGSVEAREAYRHSPDRPGFLAALNRNGIDISFVERLANG